MKSPESLVQIQNNFTEMFLMLPSTKIYQKVQLDVATWPPELNIEISLNHTSLASYQYIIYLFARSPVSDPGP